jgi:hypothetical protein
MPCERIADDPLIYGHLSYRENTRRGRMSLRALSWVCLLHNSDEVDKSARTGEPGTEAADHISCASSLTPRAVFRLVRALAVEMHGNWLEAIRYLNMDI